ncbi:hypothetical protein CMV_028119 [Castanea mollissima]|uniref:Uncharacterized protein n=1 Tax=Castanea mollissima TaxID=60419 RepID=A0A8J4Q8T7_9ROSI|nr:hypothetical protein CMV_028119 [Castanea mollissima]
MEKCATQNSCIATCSSEPIPCMLHARLISPLCDLNFVKTLWRLERGLPTNMNCLATDASEKLIANRKQWGREVHLRRTSTSFSTLSIKEFQNLRSLDKHLRLKQKPEVSLSEPKV